MIGSYQVMAAFLSYLFESIFEIKNLLLLLSFSTFIQSLVPHSSK